LYLDSSNTVPVSSRHAAIVAPMTSRETPGPLSAPGTALWIATMPSGEVIATLPA